MLLQESIYFLLDLWELVFGLVSLRAQQLSRLADIFGRALQIYREYENHFMVVAAATSHPLFWLLHLVGKECCYLISWSSSPRLPRIWVAAAAATANGFASFALSSRICGCCFLLYLVYPLCLQLWEFSLSLVDVLFIWGCGRGTPLLLMLLLWLELPFIETDMLFSDFLFFFC